MNTSPSGTSVTEPSILDLVYESLVSSGTKKELSALKPESWRRAVAEGLELDEVDCEETSCWVEEMHGANVTDFSLVGRQDRIECGKEK